MGVNHEPSPYTIFTHNYADRYIGFERETIIAPNASDAATQYREEHDWWDGDVTVIGESVHEHRRIAVRYPGNTS